MNKPKLNKNISIIDFVTDPQLLGLSVSQPQETLLRSIYGLPLSKSQLDVWRLCTGREAYPRHGFNEATILCGARAGKDSRIATPIAAYEACFGGHDKHLARGEKGIIPIVAQNREATRIAFEYLKSYFEVAHRDKLDLQNPADRITAYSRACTEMPIFTISTDGPSACPFGTFHRQTENAFVFIVRKALSHFGTPAELQSDGTRQPSGDDSRARADCAPAR